MRESPGDAGAQLGDTSATRAGPSSRRITFTQGQRQLPRRPPVAEIDARCRPRSRYRSRPSWISSAASTSPRASASKIAANGEIGISTPMAPGAISRSTIHAVVVAPGIPTRRPVRSPGASGCGATNTGKNPRPTEAPCGNIW
jgi:hypothetical protein